MLSSENHYPANSQDTDSSKKPLGPRPYPLGKGSATTSSENQNEMPANRPPTSPNSYYSHPYMGPRAQPSYPMYPPGHKPGYSPYMHRPQGYPPIYYSYGQPPPINSSMTSPSIASTQPTNGAPTGMPAGSTLPSGHAAARPTYPPPRTNFGVAYPPPRSYISQPTSPVTTSSSSPTQCTEVSSEGGRSDNSSHESLPGKSDEEMEKELKASLQALSIPNHAEHPSSRHDDHSPYMHRGHSDSSLANHSNPMPNTTATSSNLELPSIRHPIQNRRYNHSDSSVNNHALTRRDSINSIDSYTSDECDSLRGSTTNSDNFPLRPTSIIELRPKEFCPSKSNRNSNVPSLLNLSAPGDPLKRSNHRASMTLVNEESALGMYRETAKKTNDPNTQLEFAKFLLFSSTAFGDPNANDGNPSLKKLLDEAIYWIKKLQKAGQPEAMYIYATWLERGMYEIPQSLEKAIAYYKSSSKLGFVKSTYKVGYFYERKKGYSKAVQFYLKAASGGDVSANYRLGTAYLHGEIKLKRNLHQAMLYLARAAKEADKECPDGAYLYGIILAGDYRGTDVSSLHCDLSMGQEFITKAANLGYCPALHRLGACYEFGELGYPVDPSKSITFYKEGAEKGDAECQMALSGWYASGAEGILEQNDDLAHSWCFQATSKGLPKAEFAMGYYYEIGVGVTADPQIANDWYIKAAAHGSQDAQRRLANGSGSGSIKGEIDTLRRKEKRERNDCIIS